MSRDTTTPPPRYFPERELPPYTYVSGYTPHPIRDPRGHLFGRPESPVLFDEERWQTSAEYLYGIDLFNHGFYWESHEEWEGIWRQLPNERPAHTFFKGLIKLSAAGVKVREGRPEGVRRHARRSRELFERMSKMLPGDSAYYLGLNMEGLAIVASHIASSPPECGSRPSESVEIVFPSPLVLHDYQ
ncbi:hypothetical protein Pan216_35350 [Planctomycetes bacterium Pan216]|uniref:DUF309 domain-containing protein n=1 Tax=Kolteria novifilia TaxID=2527975 RepID=A0A518B6R4_9BACT|nr:hypothetical protein Pan216_35350 [Planctomycetes bacterium Pan216]